MSNELLNINILVTNRTSLLICKPLIDTPIVKVVAARHLLKEVSWSVILKTDWTTIIRLEPPLVIIAYFRLFPFPSVVFGSFFFGILMICS